MATQPAICKPTQQHAAADVAPTYGGSFCGFAAAKWPVGSHVVMVLDKQLLTLSCKTLGNAAAHDVHAAAPGTEL